MDGVDTRHRIVEAALDLIGAHGVGGLTNRRVAARAGVSLGTLTYHFPSRAQLLRTCLTAFADAEAARITAVAATLPARGVDQAAAAEATEGAVEATVLGPRHLGVLELYLHAARDPDLRDAAQRCWASYDRAAAAILAALGVDDSDLPAQVVALVAGVQLRRVATGQPIGGTLRTALERLAATATMPPP